MHEKENEHGIFKLFYTNHLRDNMLQWTNTHCNQEGEIQVTKNDLETFQA